MYEFFIATLIFICLIAASFGSVLIYDRLSDQHRNDDTHNVVRLVGNVFALMTSLVLGLMVNSARNTFEAVNHNMHVIATDLILLDRTLLQYGPEANDARQRLLAYVQRAARSARHEDPLIADRTSERLLMDVGTSLKAIKPSDADHFTQWRDAQQQFQKVVELRWAVVEQDDSTIPTPFLIMLVAWLVLIFASFGYRAPRNAIVAATFVVSAFLISGCIYLILDMDAPFTGPIKVSLAPLERVIAEMQR